MEQGDNLKKGIKETDAKVLVLVKRKILICLWKQLQKEKDGLYHCGIYEY